MLRDSFEHAREDVHARALAEARVDGERLLQATRSALDADRALLSAQEADAIEKATQELARRLAGADHRAIKQATEALGRATDEFAARRMDEGIRRALAGKKIGSL
jgi:molecular chaperone HscA